MGGVCGVEGGVEGSGDGVESIDRTRATVTLEEGGDGLGG